MHCTHGAQFRPKAQPLSQLRARPCLRQQPQPQQQEYKCQIHGHNYCNCPRQFTSNQLFLENLYDVSGSLAEILVICGVHPCKAKSSTDVVMCAFLHYEETKSRHSPTQVSKKRLPKADLIHDLGRQCLMNRTEALLTYALAKRAFNAFSHSILPDKCADDPSAVMELLQSSECLWVHAAKRSAQIFESYAPTLAMAQREYDTQIYRTYKHLYDRLRGRCASRVEKDTEDCESQSEHERTRPRRHDRHYECGFEPNLYVEDDCNHDCNRDCEQAHQKEANVYSPCASPLSAKCQDSSPPECKLPKVDSVLTQIFNKLHTKSLDNQPCLYEPPIDENVQEVCKLWSNKKAQKLAAKQSPRCDACNCPQLQVCQVVDKPEVLVINKNDDVTVEKVCVGCMHIEQPGVLVIDDDECAATTFQYLYRGPDLCPSLPSEHTLFNDDDKDSQCPLEQAAATIPVKIACVEDCNCSLDHSKPQNSYDASLPQAQNKYLEDLPPEQTTPTQDSDETIPQSTLNRSQPEPQDFNTQLDTPAPPMNLPDNCAVPRTEAISLCYALREYFNTAKLNGEHISMCNLSCDCSQVFQQRDPDRDSNFYMNINDCCELPGVEECTALLYDERNSDLEFTDEFISVNEQLADRTPECLEDEEFCKVKSAKLFWQRMESLEFLNTQNDQRHFSFKPFRSSGPLSKNKCAADAACQCSDAGDSTSQNCCTKRTFQEQECQTQIEGLTPALLNDFMAWLQYRTKPLAPTTYDDMSWKYQMDSQMPTDSNSNVHLENSANLQVLGEAYPIRSDPGETGVGNPCVEYCQGTLWTNCLLTNERWRPVDSALLPNLPATNKQLNINDEVKWYCADDCNGDCNSCHRNIVHKPLNNLDENPHDGTGNNKSSKASGSDSDDIIDCFLPCSKTKLKPLFAPNVAHDECPSAGGEACTAQQYNSHKVCQNDDSSSEYEPCIFITNEPDESKTANTSPTPHSHDDNISENPFAISHNFHYLIESTEENDFDYMTADPHWEGTSMTEEARWEDAKLLQEDGKTRGSLAANLKYPSSQREYAIMLDEYENPMEKGVSLPNLFNVDCTISDVSKSSSSSSLKDDCGSARELSENTTFQSKMQKYKEVYDDGGDVKDNSRPQCSAQQRSFAEALENIKATYMQNMNLNVCCNINKGNSKEQKKKKELMVLIG